MVKTKTQSFTCEECEDPCILITSYGEQAPEHCPYDYNNETLWRRVIDESNDSIIIPK